MIKLLLKSSAFILSGVIGGVVVFLMMEGIQDKNKNNHSTLSPVIFNHNTHTPIQGNLDFVTSAERSTSSVVNISVSTKARTQNRRESIFDLFGFEDFFGPQFQAPRNGSGSGVVYTSDGYIITNSHVVGDADIITVTDSKGVKYEAEKVGIDPSTDLAVIKINTSKKLHPIAFGNSDNVKVGEWVLAVGNPFGYLTSTVTAGIVSAKGRSLDIIQSDRPIEDFIQTDAAINPGNSGGALVNLNGELVGINTAIATPTGVFAGYSFAIPSNIVQRVIKDIIKNGGDIERMGLGIGGYDVNEDLVQEFKLKLDEPLGFYVADVNKPSPALLGGILPGDVIVAINGKKVKDYDAVSNEMRYTKVGDIVNIEINRQGKKIDIPIQLKKSF